LPEAARFWVLDGDPGQSKNFNVDGSLESWQYIQIVRRFP
jgi:hypothetical protein